MGDGDRANSPTRFTRFGELSSLSISRTIALPINGGIRKAPDLTHLLCACSSKPHSVLLERIEQQLHNGKKGVTKWQKVGKSHKICYLSLWKSSRSSPRTHWANQCLSVEADSKPV